MNKGVSFFYAAVFMAALVCSACDPDANDPSVNFTIENLSNYDLYNVKLLNELFVTAGEAYLVKKTPSVGVRLAPETGKRISFFREGGSDLWEIVKPITISLSHNRFVIENSTLVTQGDGEPYALSELIVPPSDVRAEAVSATSIRVSWSAVAGAGQYTLSRSTGGEGSYTQIGGDTPITGTSYTDTGLEAGVTYYYKVTAHSGDGKRTSGGSVPVSATTKPAAPVVTATASSSGITVSWDAVTGASSYSVYRAESRDGPYTPITTGSTGTSYIDDTELEPNTTYYYKVAASNAGGIGEESSVVSATTKKAAPRAFAAPESSKGIRVSWNTLAGASSYRVYRGTSSDGPYTEIGGDTAITGTSYTDTGLEPNRTYYYKVSAVYDGEEGGMSEMVMATTLAPPSAPSGITVADDTATSVRLSWGAVSNAVTYKIYYGTAPDGVTTLAGSTAATTYRVDNLLSWTRYYFAVSSLDSEGVEGAKSTAEVTATPRDPNATTISNITYSSVLGGTWTLLADGRRQSPAVDHNNTAKARISFTSNTPNTSITIRLEVSSEQRYDLAFISTLDNDSATYSSGYYEGSNISGTQSVTVTIPVPTAGSHFIDIGYGKDGSRTSGSDCAWFMVIEGVIEVSPVSVHVDLRPVTEDPPLSNASFFGNEAAQFLAGSGYDSYTWYWNGTPIPGAGSSTYTLDAASKPPGIYELSVAVTRAGKQFSARCRVTIKEAQHE